MTRLKATKTSLYKLVAEHVHDLPPMRTGTQFIKHYRDTSYTLEWTTPNFNHGNAFFSACLGSPLLTIEVRNGETGKIVNQDAYKLDINNLQQRGMVEEVK